MDVYHNVRHEVSSSPAMQLDRNARGDGHEREVLWYDMRSPAVLNGGGRGGVLPL